MGFDFGLGLGLGLVNLTINQNKVNFIKKYPPGNEGVTFKTEEERDQAILNLVNIAGTHVMFENQEIVAYNALMNPALKEKVIVSC